PEELERTVDELEAFEPVAVPALLGQLASSDERLCSGSGAALARLLQRHGVADERTDQIVTALVERFPKLAVEGQRQAPVILLDQLPPLMAGGTADASTEVRTLVVLALGTREQLLSTEALLPLLHDADDEMRTVAEQALRIRGLTPPQMRLAKMVAHPDPGVRARVPELILDVAELDA